ncbi:hypothetical protein ACTMU2_06380 [Cupriavidus basilensis]
MRYAPSSGTLYISRSRLANGRIISKHAALLPPSMVDRLSCSLGICGMPEHVAKASAPHIQKILPVPARSMARNPALVLDLSRHDVSPFFSIRAYGMAAGTTSPCSAQGGHAVNRFLADDKPGRWQRAAHSAKCWITGGSRLRGTHPCTHLCNRYGSEEARLNRIAAGD